MSAANAFDAIAWRSSPSRQFETMTPVEMPLPRWVVVVGGGVMAALMGAMVGGGLAI
ncbi:hypothetical protein JIP62_13720 [Brevundimonas vitis]|uniref:Uncharacterized protein n=1 Tax=Brevundimonas vitisensis TaxID=2800818 RepID=A0ABX7BL81_9CAUL|nr:hypothetical protein [Brevundimonas vitisensis]QQQ18334.1 hypothetical protein JIP62_13720 [Brevundimonas vitisensis]